VIKSSVIEAIGETPLVELSRIGGLSGGDVSHGFLGGLSALFEG
jgi:hypothetical protein